MKQIIVPRGVKKQLINEFYTDNKTVDSALELKTRTDLANAIRKRAFELGGTLEEVEQVDIEQPE